MLTDGLQIMIVGMGTVFLLLAILVFATMGAARIIRAVEAKWPPNAAPTTVGGARPKGGVAAAIAAAIARFQQDHDGR